MPWLQRNMVRSGLKLPQNNLVLQAFTRVPRKQWYIRDQLGHIVYSNLEEGR